MVTDSDPFEGKMFDAYSRNVRASGTLKFGYEGAFKIETAHKILKSQTKRHLPKQQMYSVRLTLYNYCPSMRVS